jgi:hypothetical protein
MNWAILASVMMPSGGAIGLRDNPYAERSRKTTVLDNDTDARLLLDLDGLAAVRVERLQEGTRRVHPVTADEGARLPRVWGARHEGEGLGGHPAARPAVR